MTIIDIIIYYGGPLSNDNANKGLPFEGPDIKRYYTQIDHRLKTLNELKMIVMEELDVNPALYDIQIIFRSPHEVLMHQINYKYMAIEADKHVKIMFDKMERIAQVNDIELYVKLELRAEVSVEEIQQTTTSLQVIVADAQSECLTYVEDGDDDEDYVDDTAINDKDFIDRDVYEEWIDRDNFEIDIGNHEIATNVHADDIFDCGEIDAGNAISVQNIRNTIPALSFSTNTWANMEQRTIIQIPSMASLNNEGASPSSSTRQWEYDVFLSFRSEDTREGFTSHLYKALCNKGITTFIDDIDLLRREEISKKIIQAIKNSSILVVVFSENYVESKWCLDELTEIVECRTKDQEVQIRPIFYNVDPSEIRNQNGNFGIALANHEKKFKNNKDKVQRWRDALRKAANAPGWHYKKGCAPYQSQADFIQNIVEEISNAKLNWMPLYVVEYPVGINSRAEAIESLLDIGLDEFCVVGMYGLPGVGKTTIAKTVYNKIAKHFDGSSFLENVRENLETNAGIIKLQKQLLNDILRDGKWKVGNSSKGVTLIKETLCCKKVFLILDDIDDSTPIENLLGKCDWFTPGSRVIITLRDRHLLTALKQKVFSTYKVKEFEVKQLNKHDALQLFNEYAFLGNKPHDEDYSKLATKFIDFSNGLPLALKIIARDLCGRAKEEWESALDLYNKIPKEDIQKILRVSFDGLEDTEKDIFLDIACFFKGWDKDYVVKILNSCELHPGSAIPRLVNKCLITVDRFGRLSMHNLIQQMGRDVVQEEAPNILRKRSRLNCYEDSLEVLKGNKGSKKIRGILLHSPQPVEVQLHTEAFKKMENLKFLIVENVHICEPLEFLPHSLIFLKWPNYPFHWPSEYFPEKLVAIEMPDSRIRLPKLIKQEYQLEYLIDVNLKGCEFITQLPKLWAPNLENLDLSYCKNLVKLPKLRAPNLRSLYLNCCKNLVEIDECFGSLEKLKGWMLLGCKKLKILPSQLRLKSLTSFYLSGCSGLEKLPNFHPEMECLKTLYLDGSGIREVPSSIEHLTRLDNLSLYNCKNLRDLPDSIFKLQQLQELWTPTAKLRLTSSSSDSSSGYGFVNMTHLSFDNYESIIELDLLMKPDYFPALESINLSGTNIVTIPESISRLPRLKSLFIMNCKLLREIQGLPQSICLIHAENCMLLDSQSPSGLLNQVIKIIGILPSGVCGRARSHKLMDPQLTNYFPSETEGAESEDGDISINPQFSSHFPFETEGIEYEDRDIYCTIFVWGTEMPNWFNHQSVENSIIFWVGRKFPKLAICVVLGREGCYGFVDISINGCEKREYGYFDPSETDDNYNLLFLHSPSQWRLQQQLNESNPTNQNHVQITYRTYEFDDDDAKPNSYMEPLSPTLIKRLGVHVECTCPSQEYETLPKHLIRLLLYCSLFPLGYEFGKEEMVQLWIAEGFIEERQRMEDTGCEYFGSLVSMEFIQPSRYDYSVDFYSYLSDEFDSNGRTGKLLYKVNEAQASHLKMEISEGSYQSVLGDKLDGASELTLYLSLPCESINDQMVVEALKRCTNLRALHLLSGCGYNVKQVPRDLFLSLKLLRTLNLSRTLISELPSSIGNVKSLRYLDVSNTHIRRLPESIDCLSNLQTLKLRGCLDFVALPKNMKKLTNLRHLELDIVRQLISMPNRIGNLTNLQTLSAFLVGRDDECGIEELKNMNDLCGTFCISRLERVSSLDKAKEAALIDKMYLDKLELQWSDIRVVKPEEEEEILKSLRPHSGLREIQILFYGGFKIPSWICDPSFADLVSITLYKCRNCEFLPSLGDLPSLKFLFIREMNEVKKIDHQFCRKDSDKGFAKLEKLEINIMLNLEEWMGVENGDLPVLRKLTVECFPKLIALPSLSCLNSLKHLEIKHCSRLQCLPNEGLPTSLAFLLIKDCPELKERCCKEEGLDWGKIEHVPNIWIDHQEISSS